MIGLRRRRRRVSVSGEEERIIMVWRMMAASRKIMLKNRKEMIQMAIVKITFSMICRSG